MAFPIQTQYQVAEKSILDEYNRQAYLGNQYILGLNNMTAGTSETNLMLVSNPSTSTKSIFVNVKRFTSLTATQEAAFRIYFNPTVTAAGTATVPVNNRTSYGTAIMQAVITTVPTTTSNGTFGAILASTGYVPNQSNLLNILDPGQTMLITVQASNTGHTYAAEISWYEI